MALEIGHYGRNITPTEAIKDGIKSLGTAHERSTVDFALNRPELGKKNGKPHTSVIFFLRTVYGTATMAIGIGHYRRNITATASKDGIMKSLDIIDERGTGIYSVNKREYPRKTRQV